MIQCPEATLECGFTPHFYRTAMLNNLANETKLPGGKPPNVNDNLLPPVQ